MSRGLRWISVLAAIALVFAIAVAGTIAAAWAALPIDQATIVIDGETVSVPSLGGWHAVLVLTMVVLAVLVACIVAAGGVAIAIVAAVLGVGVGALALVATLLLLFSPLILIGWLIWRLTRGPSRPAATDLVVRA